MGCRPEIVFAGKNARILLDQIRSIDKQRIGKKMGSIDTQHWHHLLLEMLT